MKLPLTATLLAPADAARGDTSSAVAEIVRFRLVEGVTDDAFLNATRRMQPLVEAAPGYVSRSLSRNTDGSWTDYVVWTDLDNAQAAAQEIFKDPSAKPFSDAIDGTSVDMRHEPILLKME